MEEVSKAHKKVNLSLISGNDELTIAEDGELFTLSQEC